MLTHSLMPVSSPNRFVVLLVCLALLFKAVIPAGFMPDIHALSHGSLKITICSGDGAKVITVDPSLKDINPAGPSDHGKKAGHDVCPFGAASHAALLPFLLVFAILAFVFVRRVPFSDDSPATYIALAAWPRGPPLLLN